jgi:hypothetical protein
MGWIITRRMRMDVVQSITGLTASTHTQRDDGDDLRGHTPEQQFALTGVKVLPVMHYNAASGQPTGSIGDDRSPFFAKS